MIKITHLYKSYPTKSGSMAALTDINLTVHPGEIFGVIGRSGAGKSTLIRCVNLLERPTRGSMLVNNQELTELSAKELRLARRHIGMVFQHFNLLSTRTVYQNVALPLELVGANKKEIEKAIIPLLELTGLHDYSLTYPHHLSGGQKQRVAIARALATRPQVLLCDEMTSALDPETTASILKLIKNIQAQMQLSILLITHEMEVIKTVADHVAVLDKGKVVEQGSVLQVFSRPQNKVTKTLTQAALKPELPNILLEHIRPEQMPGGRIVLRLGFKGETATQPLIDDLVRHYQARINIVQAKMEFLQDVPFGVMTVLMQAKRDEFLQIKKYLQDRDLEFEVLGYVATDDWAIH